MITLTEPAEPAFIADLARQNEKNRIQVVVSVDLDEYTEAALEGTKEDSDTINEAILKNVCGEDHEGFFQDISYKLVGTIASSKQEGVLDLLILVEADASELIEEIDNQPCAT